jgi:hypothetical protein
MPQRVSQYTITQGEQSRAGPGIEQDQACRKASFRDETSDDGDSA